MKIAKFTIKRSDIDRLIHNLQHLKKMADNQKNPRFVAVNLLENKKVKKFLWIFPMQEQIRVVVKVDRMHP